MAAHLLHNKYWPCAASDGGPEPRYLASVGPALKQAMHEAHKLGRQARNCTSQRFVTLQKLVKDKTVLPGPSNHYTDCSHVQPCHLPVHTAVQDRDPDDTQA